jgi:hypothetical protein
VGSSFFSQLVRIKEEKNAISGVPTHSDNNYSQIITQDSSLYLIYPYHIIKYGISEEINFHFVNEKVIDQFQYPNFGYNVEYYLMNNNDAFYCSLGFTLDSDLGITSGNNFKCLNNTYVFDSDDNRVYQNIPETKEIICYDVTNNKLLNSETRYSYSNPIFLFRKDKELYSVEQFEQDYYIQHFQ